MIKRCTQILTVVTMLPASGVDQAPPNDSHETPTILTAEAFSDTVTIGCATAEDFDRQLGFLSTVFVPPRAVLRTVWWSWTAPADTEGQALVLDAKSDQELDFDFIEVFETNPDGSLQELSLIDFGSPTAVSLKPNQNYRIRTFYDAQARPNNGSRDEVRLSGMVTAFAVNTASVRAIILEGSTFAGVLAPNTTELFYRWTAPSSGFVELVENSPSLSLTVLELGNGNNAVDLVTVGEPYLLQVSLVNETTTPTAFRGTIQVATAAVNRTRETAIPLTEERCAGGLILNGETNGQAQSFWWTWNPPADGFLILDSRSLVGLFQGDQMLVTPNDTGISPIKVSANLVYHIEEPKGQIATNSARPSFRFFSQAEATVIPDPLLFSRVATGPFRLPNDEPVPNEILAGVTDLNIRATSDRFVTSLEGLQNATYLEELRLRGRENDGHSVSDLSPITGLTRLEELRLPNSIKGTPEQLDQAVMDAGSIHSLEWLSLEQNKIEDRHLPSLSDLHRLTRLDLDDNLITDLRPLRVLNGVRHMDIDDNPIVDFSPLTPFQWLNNLDLTSPRRTFHSLPRLRALRTIEIRADDLGPLARLDGLSILQLTSANVFSHRLRDLTPLANLQDLQWIGFPRIPNAIRDFSPLLLEEDSESSPLRFVIRDLAGRSRVDLADPATKAAFEKLGINPEEFIQNTPDEEESLIPDGALNASIRSALRRGDPLTNPDQLTPLGFVNTSHIERLDGLEHASNLTSLTATNGWITDLSPLSGLTQLTRVDFHNNFISDVTPIASLTMTDIDLRGNPIDYDTVPDFWLDNDRILLDPAPVQDPGEAIPDPILREVIRYHLDIPPTEPITEEALAELKTLNLDHQGVVSLVGLEMATNLTGLSLRNNIVKDLSPVTSDQLRWARVAGNPLSPNSRALTGMWRDQGVIVDANPQGRFLSAITPVDGVVFADDYQLGSIRFLALFPGVKTLFLSRNYLQDLLELRTLDELETVHLDGNLLAEDDEVVALLRARGVTVITTPQRDAVNLAIRVEDPLDRRAIADAVGLPYVPPTFSEEQLASVTRFDWERSIHRSGVGFVPIRQPEVLSQMTNLEYLSVENASITDLSFAQGLTKLRRLDLDFNMITTLSPIAGLSELEELDANDNAITDLSPLTSLNQLRFLDVDDNQIQMILRAELSTTLRELDFANNRLDSSAAFVGLTEVDLLDLSMNEISDFSSLVGRPIRSLRIPLNGLDITQPRIESLFRQLKATVALPVFYPQMVSSLAIETGSEDPITLRWMMEPQSFYQIESSQDLREWSFITSQLSSHAEGLMLQDQVLTRDEQPTFYRLITSPNR